MARADSFADGNSITPPPRQFGQARRVAHFEIKYLQYLNHLGEVAEELPEFAQERGQLLALYRAMVLTRTFDKKAIALQRTGKLGTYASSLGQEAAAVGVGAAMAKQDVLLPAYREYGAQFLRGVSMTEILLYWGGDERGMNYGAQAEDFPICVPIATHAPHAVGVAYAMKLRGQARVAVCALGDGATSKGDFYEAVNIAGAWQLPLVFIVNNNQWAISVSRAAQTRAETLAQKAIAAGIPGEQVDGNDVIAVRERVAQALDTARHGGGPRLIEALTYRMGDHTTADDASRYRPGDEVEQQRQYDPIARLHKYLARCGEWSQQQDDALYAECEAKVDAAVKDYLATPAVAPESMFDYLYEKLPVALRTQRESLSSQGESGNG